MIPKRSLIFMLCENSLGCLAGLVAFLNNQSVPLLLDAKRDAATVSELMKVYRPKHIYLPSYLSPNFPPYKKQLESYGYTLLRTEYAPTVPLYDNLALLLTTSGSTGSPKLVRLSYKNLSTNGESIITYLDIDASERPITTLPMHYSYGFSIVNSHLLTGATVLLTNESIVQKKFWDFFRNAKATSFSGVPYTFEMLKRMRFNRMELPSLKTMTQAGGKLSLDLTREFAEYAKERGIRFFVMYGQSEAAPRMSYLPAEFALTKCGSIGKPVPGGEIHLVDDKNNPIEEPGRRGELVYHGDNVFLGYSESVEDLAKGDEQNGVLFTGDIAWRDEAGFYYIESRKKRFIKLFGTRVSLDEAEQFIKKTVSDCACTGSDDLMMIYVTERGREKEIRQMIVKKTGIHPSAFNVTYIPSIPKNAAGKTLYSKLQAP
jgi:acyl-coenzyme A synthetase/AMP-(fatty) acid ligase